jgi:hypothetical protein
MRVASRLPAPFLLLIAFALAPAAAAEEVVLRTPRDPGDTYRLSLEMTSESEARARTARGRSVERTLRLAYEATVVVLEVDLDGHPLREHHRDVVLRTDDGERSGSVFGPGTAFEVRREPDGVRLFVRGHPVRSDVQDVVARVLEGRLEGSREAALLEPGRRVEPGERWALDAERARGLLAARGVKVLDFDGTPEARLEAAPGAPEERVLRYAIPVAWFEPTERLAAHLRPGSSEARFEGEIRLAPQAGRRHRVPVSRAVRLTSRLHGGVADAPGLARSVPWRMERSTRISQRTTAMEPMQAKLEGLAVSDAR